MWAMGCGPRLEEQGRSPANRYLTLLFLRSQTKKLEKKKGQNRRQNPETRRAGNVKIRRLLLEAARTRKITQTKTQNQIQIQNAARLGAQLLVDV